MRTTSFLLILLFSLGAIASEGQKPGVCYETIGFYERSSKEDAFLFINHEASSEKTFRVLNMNEVTELKSMSKGKIKVELEVVEKCDFQCNAKILKIKERLMPWDSIKPIAELDKCSKNSK